MSLELALLPISLLVKIGNAFSCHTKGGKTKREGKEKTIINVIVQGGRGEGIEAIPMIL
jgi:hypothetical protein